MQTRDQDSIIKIYTYVFRQAGCGVFLDAIVIISLAVESYISKIVYAVGCLRVFIALECSNNDR